MSDKIVKIGTYEIPFNKILDTINYGYKEMKIKPLNKRINGPKELKKIITIYQDILSVFEKQLVLHNGLQFYLNEFISSNPQINLDKKENLINSRDALTKCLNTLEILRKRYINNKQQRKTARNQNILLLRELRKLLPPATFSEFGGGFSLEEDPQNDHITVHMILHMNNSLKEFHYFAGRHILNDINIVITKQLPELLIQYDKSIKAIVAEPTSDTCK